MPDSTHCDYLVIGGGAAGCIVARRLAERSSNHVILLEDSKPIEAPPIDEVKAQLTQQLQQQNVKKQVEALKAAAKIELAGASAPVPRCSCAARTRRAAPWWRAGRPACRSRLHRVLP